MKNVVLSEYATFTTSPITCSKYPCDSSTVRVTGIVASLVSPRSIASPSSNPSGRSIGCRSAMSSILSMLSLESLSASADGTNAAKGNAIISATARKANSFVFIFMKIILYSFVTRREIVSQDLDPHVDSSPASFAGAGGPVFDIKLWSCPSS